MIMNNTGTFKNVQVNVNFSKFLPKNFKIDRSWLKLETEKKIELIYYMFAICGGYVIKFYVMYTGMASQKIFIRHYK